MLADQRIWFLFMYGSMSTDVKAMINTLINKKIRKLLFYFFFAIFNSRLIKMH